MKLILGYPVPSIRHYLLSVVYRMTLDVKKLCILGTLYKY